MASFLGELKRRKVIRSGVIYAAASFAVLEGLEFVLTNLGMSTGVMQFLVLFAILGSPIVLAVSWYFELTPEGLKRSGDEGEAQPTPWISPASGVLTALLVAAGGAAWWISSSLPESSEAAESAPVIQAASIAVLPFANLSADPDNEYFSDGLSEELLNVLTRVPGLRVAARTSSFSFKGKDTDVREIGDALAVANVLEGSVRKSSDRVRISAQLVQAEDGFQLWSQSYDRNLDDIFAVQDEIATAIVGALEMTLVGGVEDVVPEPVSTNQMAYDKYLWGRYNLEKRTEAGVLEAIENFGGSIMLDSTYARAYSGLADANLVLPRHALLAPAEAEAAYGASLEMGRRAVELDPTLAEAQTSLAGGLVFAGDLEGGIAALDRAIELNPQYTLAHQWRSVPLTLVGRYNDALSSARIATSLDPLSVSAALQLGMLLRIVDRPDDALRPLERALALEAGSSQALLLLAFTHFDRGAWDEARGGFQRWAEAAGHDVESLLRVVNEGIAFAEDGSVGDASTLVANEPRGPSVRAIWYAMVGQDELAIREIQRAYDVGDSELPTQLFEPLLVRLREDVRVQAVARELGIRW